MVHVYHSWSTSRLIATAIVAEVLVALVLLASSARRRGARYGGLINGLDNRWSTSKVSILLWTLAMLWAFITLIVRYGGSAIPSSVPAAYFALLGIPSAGALGAKAITSQASGKTTQKDPPGPVQGLAQIFCDDTGAVDLLDSQYFLFNLVLLAYFLATFWHIPDPKPPSTDIMLPALPGSLLALTGISTATYLGKKGLSESTNQISAGSSLQVTADSDVSLPGGGTITLASPGTVTLYPGVTYATSLAATVQTAIGGELVTTTRGRVKPASGARISAASGARIDVVGPVTALVNDGATALNGDGTPAHDVASGAKSFAAGDTVTFATDGLVILTANDGVLAVPAHTPSSMTEPALSPSSPIPSAPRSPQAPSLARSEPIP
jgi:hypothetical protein